MHSNMVCGTIGLQIGLKLYIKVEMKVLQLTRQWKQLSNHHGWLANGKTIWMYNGVKDKRMCLRK